MSDMNKFNRLGLGVTPCFCLDLLAPYLYSMKREFCLLLPRKHRVITEHSEKFNQPGLRH